IREDVVEKCTGPALANAGHDFSSWNAELVEDHTCHQRGAIETHSTVRKNAMAAADQLRTERGNGVESRHRRQLFVVDREVNVEAALRRRRNAVIEAGIHVDHRVDAEVGDGSPLADGGGDEELSFFV